MSSSSILERQAVVESLETLATPDGIHEFQLQLAEESRRKGYSFLWETLHSPRLIAELRATLRTLDIQPFSPTSVEEYKRQTRKRLNRKGTFVRFTGWSLVLLAAFLYVNALWYADSHLRWLRDIGWTISFMTGCSMLMFSRSMRWNWRRVHLSSYRRPIPEFVLETACRIKDRMPEATLWIEELVRGPEAQDPFLVVQAGTPDTVQETYYVEVFNEPRFERLEGRG